MPIGDYLAHNAAVFLNAASKKEAFQELAEFFTSQTGAAPGACALYGKMLEREESIPTWISRGIAIPHVIMPGFAPARLCIGISKSGIAYDSPDGEPVHLLVLIVGDGAEHLEVLRQVALRLSSPHVYENIIRASCAEEACKAFSQTEEASFSEEGPASISRACLHHARELAREVGASCIFVHSGSLEDLDTLSRDFPGGGDNILFVTNSKFAGREGGFPEKKIIEIPFKGITRANQIELSVIFALSRGLVDKSARVISVFGLPDSGILDAIQITEISREFKVFFSLDSTSTDLQHQVLVRAIEISGELAEEGREGKPSGCIFVLGDDAQVKHHCQQMIINPFKGYAEGELNILDPSLKETVKELSKIDGAFIVRGDGVLLSAGTYLRSRIALAELPSGLGARHAAAAAITLMTRAVSVALSESTRKISIFKNGEKIMVL